MDEQQTTQTTRAHNHWRLAHAYVPFQRFSEIYSPEVALNKGTLFPGLWMPYKQGPRGYY